VLTSCDMGFDDCSGGPGDGCESDLGDIATCGSCGNDCGRDNALTGCNGGSCSFNGCVSGFGDCNADENDGCEAEYDVDPNNCDSCGKICKVGQGCAGGICGDTDASCSDPGASCNDTACTQPGRFAVTPEIAVDTLNGRRLWAREALDGVGGYWAEMVCMNLELEGITGWRLPSPTELKSLIYQGGGANCSVCDPAWDQAVFPPLTVSDESFWTNDAPSQRTAVYMCSGTEMLHGGATSRNVRCVHDPVD